MTRHGIITGIKKEAVILDQMPNRANTQIRCAGANTARAFELASSLAKDGCDLLISFGVAGALDPAGKPGDLILANSVVTARGEVFTTDPDFSQKIISQFANGFQISNGALFGADKIISSATEKARLYQASKAVAVDMESGGVARAALEHNCPFVAIRVISDTAEQTLPATALTSIDAAGNIMIGNVLRNLVKHPAQLPDLLRLARNSRKAFATLSRVAVLGLAL